MGGGRNNHLREKGPAAHNAPIGEVCIKHIVTSNRYSGGGPAIPSDDVGSVSKKRQYRNGDSLLVEGDQ